jgi:hypothetical protein
MRRVLYATERHVFDAQNSASSSLGIRRHRNAWSSVSDLAAARVADAARPSTEAMLAAVRDAGSSLPGLWPVARLTRRIGDGVAGGIVDEPLDDAGHVLLEVPGVREVQGAGGSGAVVLEVVCDAGRD